MSYDFALRQVCTHETCFEAVTIDSDGMTVTVPKPPSGTRMKLYIDGVEIPPGGLVSRPTLAFSNSGPYRIRSNVNDLLYIAVGSEMPQIVPLLKGVVKAQDLANDLQRRIPSLQFSVKRNRVVIQTETAEFGTAFSFPNPLWTDPTGSLITTSRISGAFNTLGIVPGRAVTGRELFPAWYMEKNVESVDERDKLIKFRKPVINHDPIIQLSYVTFPEFCRRCQGSRIEYDYRVVGGTYETVKDVDLLFQEVDKFLFTRIGSHWKWAWLGSNIVNRVGQKGSTGFVSVDAAITLDITQAFSAYQNIKMQQDTRFPAQQVSDAEYPKALGNVSVSLLPEDPTIAFARVSVVSRSTIPVVVQRIVPDPSSLLTTNGFLLRG